MAITYGFYNSLNGDRKYNAFQMSSIFDGVIRDGVFQSIGGYLATKPGEGMQVIVAPGKAWFDHTWTVNDADLPLEIAQSDLTLSRYDAVVLETDATKSVRENSIKVLKGAPASDPQKPTLINKGDVHQHPLAYILVPGGSSSIQVQNIDIMVGKTECPFVTSILESVSIEALLAKWEGEFRVWFDELQNQMAGDVATNLQNQITRNAPSVGDIVVSYNDAKGGPWLPCNGKKYNTAEYSELYNHLLASCSYKNKAPLIPHVSRVLFLNDKAFYLTEDDEYIFVANDKWSAPDFDNPIKLRELLYGKMPTASYSLWYANGYYVILATTINYNGVTQKYVMSYLYSSDLVEWKRGTLLIPTRADSAVAIFYHSGEYAFVVRESAYAHVFRASSIDPSDALSNGISIGGASGLFSIYAHPDGNVVYFIDSSSGSTGQNWKLNSDWSVSSFTMPTRGGSNLIGLDVIDGKLHATEMYSNSADAAQIHIGIEGSDKRIGMQLTGNWSNYYISRGFTVVESGTLYIYIANKVYRYTDNATKIIELVHDKIPYIMGFYPLTSEYAISGLTIKANMNAKGLIAEPSKQTIIASCFRSISSPSAVGVHESVCRSNSPYATPFVSSDQGNSYIRSKK